MTKQLVGLLIVFVVFTLAPGLMDERKKLEMIRGKEVHISESRSVRRVTLYKAEIDLQSQTEDDVLFQDCSPYEKKKGCEPKNNSMFSSRIVDSGVFLTALAACKSGNYLLDIIGDPVIKKVVFVKGLQETQKASNINEDTVGNSRRTTERARFGIALAFGVCCLAICGIICYKKRNKNLDSERNLQESPGSRGSAGDQETIVNTFNEGQAAEQVMVNSTKMAEEQQNLLNKKIEHHNEDLKHPESMSGPREDDQEDSTSHSCPEAMNDDDDNSTKCIIENNDKVINCNDVGYNSYNNDSSHYGDGNRNNKGYDVIMMGGFKGSGNNNCDYYRSKTSFENSKINYNDANGKNKAEDHNNDNTCNGVDDLNDVNSQGGNPATVLVLN